MGQLNSTRKYCWLACANEVMAKAAIAIVVNNFFIMVVFYIVVVS
jgi:hypothetical protein